MPILRKMHFALALCLVLSGVACTTIDFNLPPVTETPTSERAPGKIIWRDLLTNDPSASQQFYEELFGWEFESIGDASNLKSNTAYTLIRHNGALVGGMVDTLALNNRSDISQWVVSMSVDDLAIAVAKVVAAGGEIVTPPTNLQSRGRIAIVRDAEGALLGLLQTRDGDPPDLPPQFGEFLWDELWTTNVVNATSFYGDIAGLTAGVVDVGNSQDASAGYQLLKAGDQPRVGIMQSPLEGLDPVWVSYLRVEDPSAVTERVAGLGGRVIVEPRPRPLGGTVAFIAGPSGAGIALQTWPLEKKN